MGASLKTGFRALRRRLRARAISGSAAIEFAFVAPIFFALLLGIIETGVMYFTQFTLQNAVMTAARLVRTGQAQATNYATAAKCSGSGYAGSTYASSQDWFKDQICCNANVLITACNTNLHVAVQKYSGFGTGFGSTQTGTDANGNPVYANVTDSYNPGSPCDVVLIRATYGWTVVTPGLSWFLVNMTGNQHLLSTTAAFRNEPYTSAVGGC